MALPVFLNWGDGLIRLKDSPSTYSSVLWSKDQRRDGDGHTGNRQVVLVTSRGNKDVDILLLCPYLMKILRKVEIIFYVLELGFWIRNYSSLPKEIIHIYFK